MAEKPKLKGKPSLPNKSSSQSSGQPKQNSGGGKPPHKKVNQNGDGNSNNPPSPWLDPDNEPKPNPTASFVEYLRWMRPLDPQDRSKDVTKTQILHIATEKANYGDRLKTLNQRTELIAGKANTFKVTCPWRIRVGGHRGPESILLPAFDALGIPFIPSSTLRGVARNQAVREILEKNPDWQTLMAGDRKNETIKKKIQRIWDDAHKQLAPYFGSLDADKKDQAGKIVFLDSYPIAGKFNLEMDMANNIWNWKDGLLDYSPNPNAFLSLKETSFLIGLKLIASETDQQLLEQVQDWLITGLANGAGSQINTGYGELFKNPKQPPKNEFLKIEFALEGQLIHGYQEFKNIKKPYKQNRQGKLVPDTIAKPEIRPTAFKSMLRYWFRALALGIMSGRETKELEAIIFGGIDPQSLGLLQVQTEELDAEYDGEQEGILRFLYSPSVQKQQQKNLQNIIENLTWFMFYLGGVGQGARRPSYERQRTPTIRGSKLYIKSPEKLSKISGKPQEFAEQLRQRFQVLYEVLEHYRQEYRLKNKPEVRQISPSIWHEIFDQNCRVFVVPEQDSSKPYSLHLLHQQFHDLETEMQDYKRQKKFKEQKQKYSEMKNLCGGTEKDLIFIDGKSQERKAIPSPIWIRDLERFQVVTIFGATASPRRDYLKSLNRAIQVFPFK